MRSMPSTPEEMAYEQALAEVQAQEAYLGGLRTRTTTVLAAAAASVSFLLSHGVGRFGLAAVSLIGILGAVCSWVLWPRNFDFTTSVNHLLAEVGGKPAPKDSAALMRSLFYDWAYHLEESRRKNQETLGCLTWGYSAACILLPAAVILAVVNLALR